MKPQEALEKMNYIEQEFKLMYLCLAIIFINIVLMIFSIFYFSSKISECQTGTFESQGLCVPFRSDMQRDLYLGNDLDVATTF